MPSPKEVGPRDTTPEGTDTNNTSHAKADTHIVGDRHCRCAYGEPCLCDFYADWTCDWVSPKDTPSQLKHRNEGALRMVPQDHSGRRDPISARLGRWAA